MRNQFDMQLDNLNDDLIEMGAFCENAIATAVKALLNDDVSLCEKAINTDKKIDQKERDIETLCLKILLSQQPVAKDLRLVSSALKMITDMERIGDQASDIAEIVKTCDLTFSQNDDYIANMANTVIKMVTNSIDAFVKKDLELANAVIACDDVVDELFIKVKNHLIAYIGENKNSGEAALDILMIAKYLERIGDHATNIAEWVVFSISGIHKKD